MNLCILVPAADVDKVREKAATIDFFAKTSLDKLMNVALSETGQEPATHYFCYAANLSEELYNKILGMKQYSEMSDENPKNFLKSKNLKVISKDG